MLLSHVIDGFMQKVRDFLADDECVLLDLDVRSEQEPQVAKLLDAVCAEKDDLVIPVEVSWTAADELCAAVAAELADSVAQAREAFGDEEGPRFAFPAAPPSAAAGSPPTSPEIRLVEYAEKIHRALSNHVRRMVIVLALRCEPARRPACAASLNQLLRATGTPDLKWILFAGAGLVTDDTIPRPRRGSHAFDDTRPRRGLARLALDPMTRVETLRRERAVLRPLERSLEDQVIPGTSFVTVVVEGLSYGNRMFFFTEAARTLTRKCAEIERRSSGGKHVEPLVEEAAQLVGHVEAEIHFAELCERLTMAMLKDHGGLLVILAPSEATPADGLGDSVDVLARSAASTRVRYLFVDARLPDRFDPPEVWKVSRLAYVLGAEQIEQGLHARLAAPDCSLIERLRYTTALSSMALAKDDPEAALGHALSVLELSRDAEEPQETTSAWYGLGNTLYQCGAFEPAEQAYAECVDRALDEGSVALAAQGMAGLGHTHFMRRQYPQAIAAYGTAGTLWRKQGLRHGEVYALTWQGEAEARKGALPVALERMERALQLCADVDPSQADAYQPMRAELLQRQAAVHGLAKRREEQKRCLAEAAKLGATAPVCDHP
ncbi:MAG TPA: hypothetical protein VIU64_10560 [Polyangia bacterium]